jgi:ech hydrogenase subunit D
MANDAVFHVIKKSALPEAVGRARSEGRRLVQISATRAAPGFEVNYSFARGYDLDNYRIFLAPGEPLASVSGIFPTAFLYENEMHDLFGIPVENMTVDYKGGFYTLAKAAPYGYPAGPEKAGN